MNDRNDAFVIETSRYTAGIAFRERSGFRFYASDNLFGTLDNRHFDSLRALHRALEQQAEAHGDPNANAPRYGRLFDPLYSGESR
jgi:hypothetical protein